MMSRLRSLQGRVVALVLCVVLGIWLVSVVAAWMDASHELDELLDGHLAQAAALLVAQQAHALSEDDHEIQTETLHRYAPKVAFQVFHEGALILKSANAPSLPMTRNGRETEKGGFDTVRIEGHAWRVFAAHGAERDIQVYVGEMLGSRSSILHAVLGSMFWPMAFGLPLLGLAIWWAVRRSLAPLRELGALLAQRKPQILAPVHLQDTASEIAPIVDSLNALLRRIADLLESERRFTADAAHELRTPIAAIRAQAQVALAESDDRTRRDVLRKTLDGCDRAARLVEQLLTLSRMESVPAAAATIDLAAITRNVMAELAPAAVARAQSIELIAPDACTVQGNDALLAVLVRNLVDNAIRYSPASARVRVTLNNAGNHARLCVEDSGHGMSDEDIARLGERFFRVLGSGESGSGLGWSIVRRVAEVHALTLNVGRSSDLGGLLVQVTWPDTDAPAARPGGSR